MNRTQQHGTLVTRTRTTFDEGESAGFLGLGRDLDPYRREPAKAVYSLDWQAGYTKGEAAAQEMLYQKRLDFTKGLR